MSKAIAVRKEQQIARPLGVLIPLIRGEIEDAERAALKAAQPYQIAAGEMLIEAKSQVKHGDWEKWVRRSLPITPHSAREWMAMARQNVAVATFSSSHDFRMKTSPRYAATHKQRFKVPPKWQAPVKEIAGAARDQDGLHDKETKAEQKLALRLIEIGYKVLSVELHPDKGGSSEAMSRLNTVRDLLKERVNEW